MTSQLETTSSVLHGVKKRSDVIGSDVTDGSDVIGNDVTIGSDVITIAWSIEEKNENLIFSLIYERIFIIFFLDFQFYQDAEHVGLMFWL